MASTAVKEEIGSPALSRPRMFSMRIVHLDFYMAAPLPGMDSCYSHFQGRGVREVPVVRIFGSTTSGQKTCVHVHKAFPYFYVSYDEDLPQGVNEALAFVRRLASAVEKALKLSSSTGAKRQHVHSCSLVRGRKYYGYYPNEQLFVKIVLYYPQEVSRTSHLLLSGGIMNHKFQSYEAHFPYLLQIMIDYNLCGMGHVHFSSLKFRPPLPEAPSNIKILVRQVKSEYLFQTSVSVVENQNKSSASLAQLNSEKILKPDLYSSPCKGRDVVPSMYPAANPSPGNHQSGQGLARHRQLWFNGSVSGEWIWPVLASSQGQGIYSKQTTCELEADTTVEDILNRGELLFRPLQQTGPEVKMVQSLTPIWEEELLRSGIDGPAGPVNAQYEPTARTVPPSSPVEQAMRDALFQIANSEEHQIRIKNDMPSSGDPPVKSEIMPDAEQELKLLIPSAGNEHLASLTQDNLVYKQKSKSPIQSTAKESLLECTQLANGQAAFTSPEFDSPPILKVNLHTLSGERSRDPVSGCNSRADPADITNEDGDVAINEEAIKSHLSQRFQSQELDREVAEFLRWMGAAGEAEDGIIEDKGADISLSQIFSSPGMDSALLKALADYESASEKECRAILDCGFDENLEEGPVDDVEALRWNQSSFLRDPNSEMRLQSSSRITVNTNEPYSEGRRISQIVIADHIPQVDGACDEEDVDDIVDHYEPSISSKKPRFLGESLLNSSSEESKEVSLRDMMRRQRERRPRRKEVLCSPTSLQEEALDKTEPGNLEKPAASISISVDPCRTPRSMKRLFEEKMELSPSKPKSNSSSATTGRQTDRHLEHEKKGRSNYNSKEKDESKILKYGSLPLVKVNTNNTHVDLNNQNWLRTAKKNRKYECDQRASTIMRLNEGESHQEFQETSLVFTEKDTTVADEKCLGMGDLIDVRNAGDGRDCGGGQRSSFECLKLEQQSIPDNTSRKKSIIASNFMRLQTSELEPFKMEGGEQSKEMQLGEMKMVDAETRGESLLSDAQQFKQQNLWHDNLIFPSRRIEEFSQNQEPMVLCSAVFNPCSENLSSYGNTTEMHVQHLPNDERRENGVPISIQPFNSEDETGRLILLDDERVSSPLYHFTDMPDSSQNSFDSETRDWGKDHEWEATEAFFEDEIKQEFESFQRQCCQVSGDNSICVPTEARDGVGLSEGGQNVYRSTPGEHVVVSPSKQKVKVPVDSDMHGLLHEPQCADPLLSLLPSTLGHLDMSVTPHRRISLGPSKSGLSVPPEKVSRSLTPLFQESAASEKTRLQTKATIQDRVNFSSPGAQVSQMDQVLNINDNAPLLRKDSTVLDEDNEPQTHCQKILPGSREQSSKKTPSVPCYRYDKCPQLFPLAFHQRPPHKEELLMSFKELASNFREEGGVYYGNAKDVPGCPSVMAGLVFDVKSKEAVHLKPFLFGGSSERSNFEQSSRSRQYVELGNWGAEYEMDSVTGMASHFNNDGTVLYVLCPAKSPPSPLAVREWVSSMQPAQVAQNVKGSHVGEQMFTLDANTGKLVPLKEIGSANNSQDSMLQGGGSSQQEGAHVRPASPKYDERHVLNMTHPSSSSPSHISPQIDSIKSLLPDSASKQVFPPLAPGVEGTSKCGKLQKVANNVIQDLMPQNGNEQASGIATGSATVNALQDVQEARQTSEKLIPKLSRQWRDVSQMTAISPGGRSTPLSQAGFRDPASIGGGQQITLMSIEVFAETRGDLLPDPRYDSIGCIVLVINEDDGKADSIDLTVVLVRDKEAHSSRRCVDGIFGCETIYLPDEVGLLMCFARLVHLSDPDVLLGWEIQGHSLGLLAERASNLGMNLLKQISRIPQASPSASDGLDKETGLEDLVGLFDNLPVEPKTIDEPIIEDEWGRTHGSGLHVGGRIVLNIWRIMRGELKLGIYSLEAVAEAVLRRRVPRVPWWILTKWFSLGPGGGRFRCLNYFIDRARLNLQILDQLDLVNRTAELARVFGIDFYSVLSRGSQFRVESMMARLAHTQNYILVSPTRQQVADQPAMECLPLVMEPESRFYTSPVIVLDFQSLYPSMIIAYNLCYSTCLGKLVHENPKVLGVSKLTMQPGLLDSLKECMTITPNGVMFTPREIRPGVIPRLLQEILSTRIMVKKAMKKLAPEQRVLQRVLNARQFALKLIANVTYGYTAAGFSGRMPCAEIADSIVQCGRLTLERAIHLVNTHARWGARVVYGDTDSMFVLVEGRTREEAHAIGQEIAAAVTATNPAPVTLKLEKVYHPCVLLTKKRYVGYSYESASQLKPTFDAKGIETIRRDSCPAVAKALEHSLRLLFESQDLSQVKQYLQRQWGKILSGRVSLQDFIFAKEVRLGTYSSRSPVLPPAAIVASKAMAVDPRAEPRYGERIPYVVVHGEPGARLVDMVVDPLALINEPGLRLHDTYYITKQIIPACQRIFMMVGVDLRAWFSEMPRVYRPPVSKRVLALGRSSGMKRDGEGGSSSKKKGGTHGTIDQYYMSSHCSVCGEFTRASQLLCAQCHQHPRASAILLPGRTSRLEREFNHLQAICRHCGGGDGNPESGVACISLDCSVFFERRKVQRELQSAGAVASDLGYYSPCLPELF